MCLCDAARHLLQAAADGSGGGDLHLAAKAADPAVKLVADADGHGEVEMRLSLRDEDGRGAKAFPHGGFKIGGAAQGDGVLRPAVHVEMLFEVAGQVKPGKLRLAPAGSVQHQNACHFVHPVVADAGRGFLILIGNEVVAAVFPDHLPGADGARLGAAYFFCSGTVPSGPC